VETTTGATRHAQKVAKVKSDSWKLSDTQRGAGQHENKTLITNSVLFILAGILSFAGCGKKEPAEEQPVASSPAPAPAATPIDPATAATVSGTVKFEGAAC